MIEVRKFLKPLLLVLVATMFTNDSIAKDTLSSGNGLNYTITKDSYVGTFEYEVDQNHINRDKSFHERIKRILPPYDAGTSFVRQ